MEGSLNEEGIRWIVAYSDFCHSASAALHIPSTTHPLVSTVLEELFRGQPFYGGSGTVAPTMLSFSRRSLGHRGRY